MYGFGPSGVATDGGVFSIGLDGSNFQVLHAFGTNGVQDGLVQFDPQVLGLPPYLPGGLTAVNGVLYGTTGYSGAFPGIGPGEVFRINPDGSGFKIVHTFEPLPGDGAYPFGDLTLIGNTLYGTTTNGEFLGGGTIYAITVPEPSSWLLAAMAAAALVPLMRKRQ